MEVCARSVLSPGAKQGRILRAEPGKDRDWRGHVRSKASSWRAMVRYRRMDVQTQATSGNSLLAVADVSVHFGGIVALDGVSFDIAAGQVAGLIGPNGAGKTTLFNCLSRLYRYNRGAIVFDGRPLLSIPGTASPLRASAAPSRTWRCSAP